MISNKISPVVLARVFFILLATWMTTYLAWETHRDPKWYSLFGFIGATLIVLIEYSTNAIASRKILIAIGGFLIGLLSAEVFHPTFGWLIGLVFRVIDSLKPIGLENASADANPPLTVTPETARFICHVLFGYFGLLLALRHADWLRLGNLKFHLANPADRPKVLDSSVIIDGRIIDMVDLGMFEGAVFVPYFVVNEIQLLSDSSDDHRRSRGKRGLEALDRLRQKCPGLDTLETDYPEIQAVDDKLIRLCRELNADLVSNDANLQKVAKLQQIHTLNINELASVLQRKVHIGDLIQIQITKPGKEPGQGIGYLDDGSMVVVDGGAKSNGKEIDIEVVSMIQNPTGRMVFARALRDEAPPVAEEA